MLWSSLPHTTVLRLAYGVYMPLISYNILSGSIYIEYTTDCMWFLEEVEVPQKGVKRTSRSRTKIKTFQHGLLLCHEFTPVTARYCRTSLGLTEAIRNLHCVRINAERFWWRGRGHQKDFRNKLRFCFAISRQTSKSYKVMYVKVDSCEDREKYLV